MKRSAGDIIRYWRKNRDLSQMALADRLGVSLRHLSYMENDKSKGSRELLLQLAECMNLSLRACNALLSASGYAPKYRQLNLSASEDQQARQILESILKALEPNPAMIIDQRLNILMCNRGMDGVIDTFAANPERLRVEPLTVHRLNFHPDGLKNAIVDQRMTMGGHLGRLHRALESPDFQHEDVGRYRDLRELAGQLGEEMHGEEIENPHLIIPIELKRGEHRVSFYTAITSLGSAQDVTLQELQIDIGFPTDEESSAFMASFSD